ncbi:hypothetical protein RUND412_008007 [Rhizina undulata]
MRQRAFSRPLPIKTQLSAKGDVLPDKAGLHITPPITPITPRTEQELRRSCSALILSHTATITAASPKPKSTYSLQLGPSTSSLVKPPYSPVPRQRAKSVAPSSTSSTSTSTLGNGLSIRTGWGASSIRSDSPTSSLDTKSIEELKKILEENQYHPSPITSFSYPKPASSPLAARKMSMSDLPRVSTSLDAPSPISLRRLSPIEAIPVSSKRITRTITAEEIGTSHQPATSIPVVHARPMLVTVRPKTASASAASSPVVGESPWGLDMERRSRRIEREDRISMCPRPRTSHSQTGSKDSWTSIAAMSKDELDGRPLPPIPPMPMTGVTRNEGNEAPAAVRRPMVRSRTEGLLQVVGGGDGACGDYAYNEKEKKGAFKGIKRQMSIWTMKLGRGKKAAVAS